MSAERVLQASRSIDKLKHYYPALYQDLKQRIRAGKAQETKGLKPALQRYENLQSFPPASRDDWNCAESIYQGIIRLNNLAAKTIEKHYKGRQAEYSEKHQQLELPLIWDGQTPTR